MISLPPTFKTAVFGLIIGLVACFQGDEDAWRHRGRRAHGDKLCSFVIAVRNSLPDVILVKVIVEFFPRKHPSISVLPDGPELGASAAK